MTIAIRRPALITVACAAALLLAGCTTPAPSTTDPAPEAAGGGDSAGGCPVTDGYELFTTDLVTASPESGAVYGDGSTLSWTFSIGEGYSPTLDLTYVSDDGTPIIMGGQNLLDEGGGVYANNLLVFDSDADGRPGFASIVLVNDGTFEVPEADKDHDQVTIGVYCVTFAAGG